MADDWDSGDYSDDVMEFTPTVDFDIRTAAKKFSKMMRESLQPLIIHLPHLSVEFEPGCTAKEIIDGYHYAIKSAQNRRRNMSANSNHAGAEA
jgi:hypothetical protein